MPLDPCFEALLSDRRIHLRPPAPPITLGDLRNGANQFMRAAAGPDVARVEPLTFEGRQGRRIAGRAYRATPAEPRPAIVFFHGGGFVFGDLDTHDAICRSLAQSSGCTVLAVDYRLAPEHPFPAAIHDAADALRHVSRTPDAFGVRPGPIGIAGDSAGAHVATGALLSTADARLDVAHLAMLYPVIDPGCNSESMVELARGYMLTRDAMQWFWDCYVPNADERANPLASVLTADLVRFPPTTIVTAEFDPLRDEGEAFAKRLAAAGVRVRHECASGMIHGFAGMPQLTPEAGRVVRHLGTELGRALGVAVDAGEG